MTESTLPFQLEGGIEKQIANDPDWLAGIEHGQPRPGHPEGQVKFHITDVLASIQQFPAGMVLA